MSTADLYGLSGQVLDGQFRIDRVIGEGGFSVVYRGHHLGLDEAVAVKCLKLQAQLGSAVVESFIRRFRDESKLHYRLSRGSLHIARTIAAGTTMAPATGALVPYMVLEWLEGFTLADELRARRQRGERGRSIQEILALFQPVADAMAFAHMQGVVHRDLTPSNVFFAHGHDDIAQLKVLDFGVAKVISDHALALGPRAATLGQVRLFTPAYAASEQFDETLGPITPRTDVYSLAMLVVELLGDRTPVDGEHLGDYADRAMTRERRPTPRSLGIEVGDGVESVLKRALAVDPLERPRDIGELWTMLKSAAAQDARVVRWSSEVYPIPPQDVAPSARAGYVTRATLGSLPAPPRNDSDHGRDRTRSQHQSTGSGSSGPPPTRRGVASPVSDPEAPPPLAADRSVAARAPAPGLAAVFSGPTMRSVDSAHDPVPLAANNSAGHDGVLPFRQSPVAPEAQHARPFQWSGPAQHATERPGSEPTRAPARAAATVLQPSTEKRDRDFWMGLAMALTVALVLVALIASQLSR